MTSPLYSYYVEMEKICQTHNTYFYTSQQSEGISG